MRVKSRKRVGGDRDDYENTYEKHENDKLALIGPNRDSITKCDRSQVYSLWKCRNKEDS